jgi:chromatin segregation and condensation protein Rec8/ScpA/Scc1 (kleisin family)
MATDELLRPTVRLDVFDGPLDLLLYLVHSHELDPRTIPVSQIADQYIAFLDSAREGDLAVAGEYLVMAAKLLSLKARELLPREQQGELEPEEFDGFDREELVKQLLEYRRFKQAAENLRGLEARTWGAYPRGMTDSQGEKPRSDDDDTLEAGLMGLFDLLKAFRSVLSVRPRNIVHEIEIDDIPLEERMNRIRAHLVREGKALFEELYPHDGRKLLPVVTFMAIMELTKNEELAFRQAGTFQPMTVYRKADERFADDLAQMDHVYTPDPEVNPDVLGLLAEKERLRLEALAREEATWGGNGYDPETGELLPGLSQDLLAESPSGSADAPAEPASVPPAADESQEGGAPEGGGGGEPATGAESASVEASGIGPSEAPEQDPSASEDAGDLPGISSEVLTETVSSEAPPTAGAPAPSAGASWLEQALAAARASLPKQEALPEDGDGFDELDARVEEVVDETDEASDFLATTEPVDEGDSLAGVDAVADEEIRTAVADDAGSAGEAPIDASASDAL